MKKVFAIFAIAALVACGGATSTVKTDSATFSTDTTVAPVDTTAPVNGASPEKPIPGGIK